MNFHQELIFALAQLREEDTCRLVQHLLERREPPLAIIESCRKGLARVGEAYSKGEYFLGDLVLSAEIFEQVMTLLRPHLEQDRAKTASRARVVFGTVEGDIHDLGKNITISLLRCYGFEVIDLGVDVHPDYFFEAVKKHEARILGLSALLTSAFEAMKRTIRLMQLGGLRPSLKIIIGGLVNERVCRYVRADAWARDAREGAEICRAWYPT